MNILKNAQIKVLSLFAALLLWLFVVGVENYVFLFPVELPVKVLNLGQNVSVAHDLGKIKVRYKVQEGAGNINANEFDLYLDAQGLIEGDFDLPVSFISKNPKLTIVATDPSSLLLKLEAITSKEINVVQQISGAPAKDFEIKNVALNQNKVKLSGAASAISSIKEIPVKISLDGSESADFSRKITLEPPPEWKLEGKTVSFDPAFIQADIEIRRKKAEPVNIINDNALDNAIGADVPVEEGKERKTLMAEIVLTGDLKTSVKELVPKNILVTIEAAPEVLTSLNNSSIKLMLKSESVERGAYVVNVDDLALPNSDLKIVDYSPEKINVRF